MLHKASSSSHRVYVGFSLGCVFLSVWPVLHLKSQAEISGSDVREIREITTCFSPVEEKIRERCGSRLLLPNALAMDTAVARDDTLTVAAKERQVQQEGT